ncbi:hypothetical protein AK812_SmicGene2545 [Symbiodinium microadriaticum]|uniref:Uncharacterized protein n=1 Tax=Symbiodinium microadriaticum TaxID=2951 RepID=A0A1Q9F179_SYMMI|nr:hypothetical protein AK812_SmicGene2545 [Symbiodinium microadriaticum]
MGCVSLRGRARAGTLILVAILSIFVGKAAFVPEMSKSCSSWKSQRGAHWTRSNKPVLVAVNQSPRNSKLHRMASIASTSSDSQQAGMSVPDAAAIIAGTALGGGFLALPSVTAPMGVMPAIFGLIVVWAFLAAVGLVYAEAPMGVMPAIFGLIVVWAFLAAVGLVYAEASAEVEGCELRLLSTARDWKNTRLLIFEFGASLVQAILTLSLPVPDRSWAQSFRLEHARLENRPLPGISRRPMLLLNRWKPRLDEEIGRDIKMLLLKMMNSHE